jgi:hypothetical protein
LIWTQDAPKPDITYLFAHASWLAPEGKECNSARLSFGLERGAYHRIGFIESERSVSGRSLP